MTGEKTPIAVVCYRATMALISLACAVGGGLSLHAYVTWQEPARAQGMTELDGVIQELFRPLPPIDWAFLLPIALFFGLGACLPRRPWAWYAAIAVMAAAAASCAPLLLVGPLLFFWRDTRLWFRVPGAVAKAEPGLP